jgi:hypothetical protein
MVQEHHDPQASVAIPASGAAGSAPSTFPNAALLYFGELPLAGARGGSSSVAERQLPKLNVAGSIPVSRSTLRAPGTPQPESRYVLLAERWRSPVECTRLELRFLPFCTPLRWIALRRIPQRIALRRSAKCRWNWTHRIKIEVIICLSFVALATSLFAEAVNGFVTRIDSSREIEIDAMHVLLTPKTACSVEVLDGNGRWSKAKPLSPCTPQKLAIGSRIRLAGHLTKDGKLIADRLEIRKGYQEPCPLCLLVFLRRTYPVPRALKESALAEEAPALTRRKQIWDGTWWVDGYRISVNSRTHMLYAPNFNALRERSVRHLVNSETGDPVLIGNPSTEFQEVRSPCLLSPNTRVYYQASDGIGSSLLARWMLLWPNQAEPGEGQFLSMYAHKVRLPDYEASLAGSVLFSHGGPIQIVPDRGAQEYISRLGSMLIPGYQRDMTSANPDKINFRFYVVRPFVYARHSYFVAIDGRVPDNAYKDLSGERFNAPVPGTLVTSVIAIPDGTILVPDVVLARMENQAQTMALLSYAITSVLQKQAFHAWSITKPHHIGSTTDDLLSYWLRNRDEQLLRIGIRQMYLAGYDIREAPFAWALAAGKPAVNPIVDSKHPDREIPWYAAYAFNYISRFYSDVDYSKLKRGRAEYAQFLKELRQADPEAFGSKK